MKKLFLIIETTLQRLSAIVIKPSQGLNGRIPQCWHRGGLIIFSTIIFFTHNYGQQYTTTITPERIILNLTTEPYQSMGVAWRTTDEVKNPQVQVAEAEVWITFAEKARTISAKSERIPLDKGETAGFYNAVIDGLKPNTLYAYRVGGDSVWSEWNQFTTAEKVAAPFTFVFLGDPQDNIKEHCSRVFREAFKKAPDAKFWLFTGDITSEPEDKQINDFYYAAGFILRMTPSILVPGNHDLAFKMEGGKIVRKKNGKKERSNLLPPTWRGQYVLPENGISGYEEVSYYVDYQGVRFIMMNTNDRLLEQAEWMKKLLFNNPNKWTVVAFHHPLYSMGRDRDDLETRTAFQSIFDEYNVDLVLTGHDHSYGRSYKIKNGAKVKESDQGTVYVVSVSGPKMYTVNSKYTDVMAKVGGNVQLFQVISIDGGKLKYNSFTATGVLYDSFELAK
ncbi:MAG: metallophosphoesterase family protein [Bacteroidota bacterium]|nr:metallophosphoesterase family protein [Bacteroidota bacterium]